MSAGAFAIFAFLVISTSFIAGVFGMAGGLLLMGGLLWLLPVPQAMILHGITQAASNGSRAALWARYIYWRIVLRYGAGLLVAAALFMMLHIVPDQRMVLILIGILPLIGFALPENLALDADQRWQAEICGFVCTVLQLISGVSGTTLDLFFVRTQMDRRAIVATKGACQVITHLTKIFYFGFVVASGAMMGWPVYIAAVLLAILGTSLGRAILERMTDHGFRCYSRWIIIALSLFYLGQGIWGFLSA